MSISQDIFFPRLKIGITVNEEIIKIITDKYASTDVDTYS